MMELYRELLLHILKNGEIKVVIAEPKIDLTEIIELDCYRTLEKIKAVIEDTSLDDESCFLKIEEIIQIFESLGSNSQRHDFG